MSISSKKKKNIIFNLPDNIKTMDEICNDNDEQIRREIEAMTCKSATIIVIEMPTEMTIDEAMNIIMSR